MFLLSYLLFLLHGHHDAARSKFLTIPVVKSYGVYYQDNNQTFCFFTLLVVNSFPWSLLPRQQSNILFLLHGHHDAAKKKILDPFQ
jgi:hypothetical protein